jgi:membrane protease YdiL (CAAX protease family)
MKAQSYRIPLLAVALTVPLLPLQLSLTEEFDWILACAGYVAIYVFCRYAGLSAGDLSLSKGNFTKALLPTILVPAALIVGLSIVYLIEPSLFQDDRYNQPLSDALFYILIALPLKIIIIEELLFRGILLTTFTHVVGVKKAAVISSLLFGLWHVLPSRDVSSEAVTFLGSFEYVGTIVGIVIATTLAGIALCYAREKFNSIYVPIAAHWAINATAVMLAYFAWN